MTVGDSRQLSPVYGATRLVERDVAEERVRDNVTVSSAVSIADGTINSKSAETSMSSDSKYTTEITKSPPVQKKEDSMQSGFATTLRLIKELANDTAETEERLEEIRGIVEESKKLQEAQSGIQVTRVVSKQINKMKRCVVTTGWHKYFAKAWLEHVGQENVAFAGSALLESYLLETTGEKMHPVSNDLDIFMNFRIKGGHLIGTRDVIEVTKSKIMADEKLAITPVKFEAWQPNRPEYAMAGGGYEIIGTLNFWLVHDEHLVEPRIQVIVTRSRRKPFPSDIPFKYTRMITSRFDLSVCQVAYDYERERFFCHEQIKKDIGEKSMVWNFIPNRHMFSWSGFVRRFRKYKDRGFELSMITKNYPHDVVDAIGFETSAMREERARKRQRSNDENEEPMEQID